MEVIYEKGPKGVVNYAKAILFDVFPDMVDYTFTTTGGRSERFTYAPVPKLLIKKFKSM
jgi:hypothetical protein